MASRTVTSKARLTTVLAREVCPNLTGRAQRVLMVLVGMAAPDGDSWSAWPGQSEIAATTGMGKRTVQKAISDLVSAGAIVSAKTNRGNRYTICDPGQTRENHAPETAHRMRPNGRNGSAPSGASDAPPAAHRIKEEQEHRTRAPSSSSDVDVLNLSEAEEAVAAELRGLPRELRLDASVARRFARDGVSRWFVLWAVAKVQAEGKRTKLRNPAGRLVQLLRDSESLPLFEEADRRRRENIERARQREAAQAEAAAEAARIKRVNRDRVEAHWAALSEDERRAATERFRDQCNPAALRIFEKHGAVEQEVREFAAGELATW